MHRIINELLCKFIYVNLRTTVDSSATAVKLPGPNPTITIVLDMEPS
jgi:hypothetical protein